MPSHEGGKNTRRLRQLPFRAKSQIQEQRALNLWEGLGRGGGWNSNRPRPLGVGTLCMAVWCVELCRRRCYHKAKAGMSTHGYGQMGGVCLLCARCVLVCCCIAGPVHTRTWPVLLWRRLCQVIQGLIGPMHHECRATPSVPSVWCRTACCCALPCTALCVLCCTAVVGTGSPASHCHNACKLWAAELVQHTASLPGGSGQELLQCIVSLPWGGPVKHCLTARGQQAVELTLLLQRTAPLRRGRGKCNPCNVLPHYLGAVGRGTPAIHCLTAQGQWAVGLLQCIATLPGGIGQWDTCNTLTHSLAAVGSATPAMHSFTAWRQLAGEFVQYIASLPRGSWQCDCCNASPLCSEAMGSGTPAIHCLTAWGQWAAQLLQCTTSLPGGNGKWDSCNAPPLCSGAGGRGTPAIYCLTARGHRAVALLLNTAPLPGGS